MAKLKIIWSNRAKIKLLQLLEFYAERNKSKTYSRKLFHTFNKELLVLSKQPEMGIKTDIESIRGLIVEDYILFYEITSDSIILHLIWDSRQNPDKLVL
ncbi:MAG: type II toxin-antitoxin system RelE/ParE family toxin [Bacteroidota bacterium]